MNKRPPAVAGSFYPADETQLSTLVEQLLHDNSGGQSAPPKVIIAPHAGYVYSGPTAAVAYNRLQTCSAEIKKVVLLGPAHRVALRGLALPASEVFETPLGEIRISTELREQANSFAFVNESEQAHAFEHSLEVHLPFLQTVLAEFELLPLVVGVASADEIAAVIDKLWGENDTLIVISTDLSHFKSYDAASSFDRKTCDRILNFETNFQGDEACGCFPLNGVLSLGARRNLRIELLDYRNSGDTAGSKDRVVGYGAFVLYEH